MNIRLLLIFVCVSEAATGLALLIHPPTVTQLLLGSGITGIGVVISRIAGIALLALGVACWPGGEARGLQAMAGYSILVAIYMAVFSFTGGQTGILWWPALAAHAVLGILMTRMIFKK